MSDLEKVISYARQLGSGTPIQLRWEASGDSIHAANLLRQLKDATYNDGSKIKYHATVNLFESNTDAIYAKAVENLDDAQENCGAQQTYSIHTSVDVTRASRSLVGQSKAHIMFVRNLMGTDGHGSSDTSAAEGLLQLHQGAVRGRSGSMSDNGLLRIGMSGTPGLSSNVKPANRGATKAKSLFAHAASLAAIAKDKGAWETPQALNKTGNSDYDDGEVMKNNGQSLGIKRTYYLTFQY